MIFNNNKCSKDRFFSIKQIDIGNITIRAPTKKLKNYREAWT